MMAIFLTGRGSSIKKRILSNAGFYLKGTTILNSTFKMLLKPNWINIVMTNVKDWYYNTDVFLRLAI